MAFATIEKIVFEIDKNDFSKKKELLEIKVPVWQKIMLFPFAIVGFLIHAPLYVPVKGFVYKKTNLTDHYDSVLTTILMIAYPIYLLLITVLVFVFIKSWWVLLLLLILPLTAWCYVRLKQQVG